MPLDENVLVALVDAAKLSTNQLENIAQRVLGTSLSTLSSASTPAQQAKDMITYAVQYGLMTELASALLYTGADRPGLQNLLFGNGMSIQTDEQRNTAVNSLDIVRLENRVGRVEDKVDSLIAQVQSLLSKNTAPLNWNIIGWGVMLALIVGSVVWAIATVN